MPVYHFDVYRLESQEDFLRCGLDEFLQTQGVSVVEWADKIENVLPQTCWRITFGFEGNKNRLIKVQSPKGRDFAARAKRQR